MSQFVEIEECFKIFLDADQDKLNSEIVTVFFLCTDTSALKF